MFIAVRPRVIELRIFKKNTDAYNSMTLTAINMSVQVCLVFSPVLSNILHHKIYLSVCLHVCLSTDILSVQMFVKLV